VELNGYDGTGLSSDPGSIKSDVAAFYYHVTSRRDFYALSLFNRNGFNLISLKIGALLGVAQADV
jgi:hypothetical protein